ncbi:DUF1801 domain-containing protein [Taibaiella soli]|uniref:DUF1801 domain-containing protein n=1 Tax=Taibaiella soli TaxID=1649169 RepID=UPI001402F2D6|nr:DUF1801 domain-containing protein [Taibaiella soli]
MMPKAENIDAYIARFPDDVQKQLQQIRKLIKKTAPGAEETISYGMPAFRQNRVLVYFAGYKNHIGFYPTGSGIKKFEKEIQGYVHSKGAVQFPVGKALPTDLIKQIVAFRVAEDHTVADLKKQAKPAKSSGKNFAASLSAPAQRALVYAGINTLKQLAKWKEADLLKLHGLGPGSLPKIREILAAEGLSLIS